MKMNQKGRGNDEFETPDYIYNQLDRIFNFEFDVACNVWNCKIKDIRFPDNFDGLKANSEVQYNNCPICVMILPLNSMDTKVWHEVIENKYHYEILKGRIAFIDPQTHEPKKGNNSGTVIVYFKKRITI